MYNNFGDLTFYSGVRIPFSAKAYLDIYIIIRGPYRIINIIIYLLYLVKCSVYSAIMQWLTCMRVPW